MNEQNEDGQVALIWSEATSRRMARHLHDRLVTSAPEDFDALLNELCSLIESSQHGAETATSANVRSFHHGVMAGLTLDLALLHALAMEAGGGCR